jgi:hypothetical protein
MQQENTSDALQHPPSFNEMVGFIKKLFTDYLEDVMKTPPSEISKAWERYKTLNHLYQDEAQHAAECEWVKASERLPGWGKSVRWRLDGIERKACDVFYMANGESPACIPNYEWYDEFPSKEGNKEREVALIQYIRENYKPSKEVWKDKFGIALLSDEGVLNKFNEWNNQQNRNND